MIKSGIMETKSTRQDRGGNRTQPFAEATEWSAACPFLGWLRRDKQGYLLYKSYCEGDGDLSSFSVDQCCCVPGKIVFHLRQPDQLSSAHTDRTSPRKETVSGALCTSKPLQMEESSNAHFPCFQV